MPKAQRSPVYKYYRYDPVKCVYRCIVKLNEVAANEGEFCSTEIKTGNFNVCSNLKRHLSRFHLKKWEEMNAIICGSNTPNSPQASTSTVSKRPKSIGKYFEPKTIKIKMDVATFKRGIVLMIMEGTPLRRFETSGFISLNGEAATKLGVSLSRESVRSYIMEAATSEKQKLKACLNGKLVHVKTDAATRHFKNYLGINVQFYDTDTNKPVIRTLAISDTDNTHTSQHISHMLESKFREFGINKENVLSLVVDNASNMTKTVERINQKSDEVEEESGEIEDEDSDEFDSSDQNLVNIHHMRCAIHTLQLAIRDGLKCPHCERILTKTRWLVGKLRTPHIRSVLQKRTKLLPLLDMPTRWGSTYLMVERLLEIREQVQELGVISSELHICENMWLNLQKFKEILEEPYRTTLKLQSEELTPGYFIKIWLQLKRVLQNFNNNIAIEIAGSMTLREHHLFQNKLFLAAVYVDPRYRILLTPSQISNAKEGLYEVACKTNSLCIENDSQRSSTNLSSSTLNMSSSDDDFEKELDLLEARRSPSNANEDTFKKQFEESVKHMIDLGRVKGDIWTTVDNYRDPLRLTSKILTAMPVSQVSVERLFSAMKFILNDLRSSMKPDLLEAILFLRCNDFKPL